MVPVYDTDIAESRWRQAEWRQFELWEKIEQRARKRVRMICIGAIVVFLLISSVPVIQSAYPKWSTLHELRKVGQLWSHSKTIAIQQKQAILWIFVNTENPSERNENVADSELNSSATIFEKRVAACSGNEQIVSQNTSHTTVHSPIQSPIHSPIKSSDELGNKIFTARNGHLWLNEEVSKKVAVSRPEVENQSLSVKANANSICFDPASGFFVDGTEVDPGRLVSLALIVGQNIPSISLLNLFGSSAEISFE